MRGESTLNIEYSPDGKKKKMTFASHWLRLNHMT